MFNRYLFFFFKQKTAYEMRISDWSSDVCSSDLIDRKLLYDFFRSWAVKRFFLAFMISIVPGNWRNVVSAPAGEILANPVNLSLWLIGAMFLVDVSLATVGYVLTIQPLDAHIRSATPYAAGWVAALICYPPFILMNPGGPLDST